MSRALAHPFTLARGAFLLPLLTCVLTALASSRGLETSAQDPNPELGVCLSILVMCTAFFAMALSFSAVVGDRDVIEREARWGVRAISVLTAKALVLAPVAVLQSVVAYTGYALLRPGPVPAVDAPAWPVMTGSLAMLGVASMLLGLLLSTTSRSLERAVFALLGATALLVVLAGLLSPLADTSTPGTAVLALLAQLTPTRWGAAAINAYLGFVPDHIVAALAKGQPPPMNDPLWVGDARHIAGALASLMMDAATYLAAAVYLLDRQHRRRR